MQRNPGRLAFFQASMGSIRAAGKLTTKWNWTVFDLILVMKMLPNVAGVYILHMIYFFSPATKFFIFLPPLVFSHQVGGKWKNI